MYMTLSTQRPLHDLFPNHPVAESFTTILLMILFSMFNMFLVAASVLLVGHTFAAINEEQRAGLP
jgi:hypothetical protein